MHISQSLVWFLTELKSEYLATQNGYYGITMDMERIENLMQISSILIGGRLQEKLVKQCVLHKNWTLENRKKNWT